MGSLILAAAPASADRLYVDQITGPPAFAPVPGPFVSPWGIAIDGSDNVWVADPGNAGVITKFSSANAYVSQESGDGHFAQYAGGYVRSLGLNNSTGYLYVADSAPVLLYSFDSGGNFVTEWGEFGGPYDYTAVDNSGGPTNGHVYVASGNKLNAYDGSGNPVNYSGSASYINGSHIMGTPSDPSAFGDLQNITTDATGDIFVYDQNRQVVDEYGPTGLFIQELSSSPSGPFGAIGGIASDPQSGSILIAEGSVVHEYDSAGTFIADIGGESTPAESFAGIQGLAVNSEGYVYISDGGHGVVDIFGPDKILPKITYSPVSNLSRTTATILGSINPDGGADVISCRIEYGLSSSYGSNVPCSPDPGSNPPSSNFTVPTNVSVVLSSLSPQTTYHYRFVTSNSDGTSRGSDQSLTTNTAVQSLSTDTPSNVTQTSATLNASFVGDSTDTHYFFEWGSSPAYGNTTAVPPGEDAGSPASSTIVSADIGGLSIYTPLSQPYHYRVVASNSLGTTYGADRIFYTAPPDPPSIISASTEAVTPNSATVSAQINPNLGDTLYVFDYGIDSSYGKRTVASESIGADNLSHLVTKVLAGLESGTTYHYRVVAMNFGGTTHGADRTFTTPGLPRVDASSATAVAQHSATLDALINSNSSPTTVHFEYGTGTSYGSSTRESGLIGADGADHPANSAITGLTAGTTYHFRVVATNGVGASSGLDQTFTTRPEEAARVIVTPHECRKRFVKRHGKCVKRRKHQRKRHVKASNGGGRQRG
jgi:hypothetical protein